MKEVRAYDIGTDKGAGGIKAAFIRELAILAEEIRTFLIEKISRTGGHLASNLGVVELTIALFKTFDLPQDKISGMWAISLIPIRY